MRFDRALRHIHDLRYLLDGLVFDVEQRNHSAFGRAQRLQRLFHRQVCVDALDRPVGKSLVAEPLIHALRGVLAALVTVELVVSDEIASEVEISLSLEKYEERPYVVMRVANNGAPFKSGFKIDDYITRGRYSASSGRSGLGGYHVYQRVKGHNGFLYLDSNKVWNVIVEVLLPIDNVETDNLVEYEHECI